MAKHAQTIVRCPRKRKQARLRARFTLMSCRALKTGLRFGSNQRPTALDLGGTGQKRKSLRPQIHRCLIDAAH